ncbi:tripartite tricarboxylate transporter TctB family protein [Tistrella mobilis]|uniref:tripartite tricarboxylate transporter TctB family protein n=1 Tax=Tistrella mobilis TaxID=171437 RepID=UPI003558CF48
MERRQDVVLGLVLAALGGFAGLEASGYRGASGHYPLALGIVLAALGLALAVRAAVRGSPKPRPLAIHAPRLIGSSAMGAAYLALVPVLGFYTASALAVATMPVALGLRRPVLVALGTVIFTAAVWLVFSVVLNKPLPPEIWFRPG